MKRHDDPRRLRHVLDAARKALEFADGRRRDDLDNDEMFSLAMTRLLEIIGEAANKLSPALREKHPEVPWPDIVGMRNRIIHGYDQVDFDTVWQTVTEDLGPLVDQVQRILSEIDLPIRPRGESGDC